MPPLSPGCLWVCSTLPFDESSPPVCSMLPRIIPPFCTSSVPVISLLVQTTSGVSRVMRVDAFTVTTGTVAVTESEAVTLAVLIPLTVSALVSGSYSITAPSGKRICRASADADGAGLLDRRDILDYVECISNGRWYEPPVSFTGLAKSLRAAVHHSSPIYVKRNILASTFIPHPWLSQQDFSRFVLDFLVFGNAFLEKRYSTTGKVIRLETSPAKYTRRGVEEDVYWWVPSFNEPTPFTSGSVFHLLEPDINQELYGLPEYLSALNSAWLNESATLFRRKYYENGAHAGYIMYVTDAVQDRNDIEMLRENMVKSKGRNNFKNLFLYAPQGKADGIKIIPLSEVATKDDFFNIKKASAADLLDAHRIPFQLMGGKPENVGSLGDIEKVAKVFVRNELIPLQDRIREINGWLGQEVIRFKNYSLDTDNG